MLAMYLILGLALNSKLPIQIAYSLASLPFIFLSIEFFREPSSYPIKSSSTEHYDRMGASMRWCQIVASGSSIFFGFLLNIAVNPPSYFTFFDNVILLASTLFSNSSNSYVHNASYLSYEYIPSLDVEKFLSRTKKPVRMGIVCITLAMYLGLGLALTSKLSDPIAYSLASFPVIFIFFEFFKLRYG